MTFSRIDEEEIRRIVREEIAADELRRIEQERPAMPSQPAVPGVRTSPPGTVFLSDCAAMRAV